MLENNQRFSRSIKRIALPERLIELVSSATMIGIENVHDANLAPEHFNYTRDQVGVLFTPNNPAARWAVDHIGDIWEISAGFIALRSLLILFNEGLRKSVGKKIPDDVQFWASLLPTVTIKALHSLGLISIFQINDHVDHPVPGMLFGQGVAVVMLAMSHYGIKNRESIKKAVSNTTAFTGNLASRAVRSTSTKIKEEKEALASTVIYQFLKLKKTLKNTAESGKERVMEPAKETYTKLKIRLMQEWDNTPLNIRTSFVNANGALLLESLSLLGGQNLQMLTLFLGMIGLLNGLSYKINPATTNSNLR